MLPRGSITAGSTLGPGALRPAGIPTFTRSERVPWREWVWAETRPMRRNYLSKEKGAEVFPERGHTHKGLGVLRREGLQRQPEAKWHGSCINWQRSEAALKAWMRMTPSDFFGCGGGSEQVCKCRQVSRDTGVCGTAVGLQLQESLGGLSAEDSPGPLDSCTQMISPGWGAVEGEEGSARAIDF